MTNDAIVAILVAVGTAFPNTTAQAQNRSCEACVTLTLVAELSTSAAPIVPSLTQSVFRTSSGRLLVSHRLVSPPQIAVYDTTGRFLQLYDAVGGGPGEFHGSPFLLDGPGDDIWALDQNRLVRFNARLQHIDTRALGDLFFVSYLVGISDSSFVRTARTTDPADSVFSVILMDTAWNAIRTLERPPNRYGLAIVAPATGGGFWTLGTNELLLRRYTGGAELSRSVEIEAPYFEPYHTSLAGGGLEGVDVPPRPRHRSLYDAGNNRVVLLTSFADEGWRPTPRDRRVNLSMRDYNARFDTVVGVIDVESGRTTSIQRLDEYLQPVAGAPDLVFAAHVNSDGHVTTRIYRIQLPAR